MILRGETEDMTEKGKQLIIYLVNQNKWMLDQGLGAITDYIYQNYKGYEIGDCYDWQRTEGARQE